MTRNAHKALKQIENLGGMLDHFGQRERLLGVGMGANGDKKAEYMIRIWCYAPFPGPISDH